VRRARQLAFAGLAVAGASLVAGRAHADCGVERPTDPGGYAGYAYGSAEVASFATAEGHVRVWWAKSGPHAPLLTSTRADGVPDRVALTGREAEAALAFYQSLGYRAPISDGGTCAAGGDDKIDVYLVTMTGSDGLTLAERCVTKGKVQSCTGALLVENDYGGRGYKNFEEGAKTVVPHEMFHLVQNGYHAGLDHWFAEGSAQWATKKLHPELADLERFLPEFFSQLERPIDVPPGGVVAGYLYGSAVFPVFLDEAYGKDTVREVLEQLATTGSTVLAAADPVLVTHGKDLATAYGLFAQWNLATGAFAGGVGYANAAKYPTPTIHDAAAVPFRLDVVSAGLSSRYYRVQGPAKLSLETDPARNQAFVVPVLDGKPDLQKGAALPARLEGEGIVIVTGRSPLKTDAPFTLVAEVPPADPTPAPPTATQGSSGCAVGGPPTQGFLALLLAPLALALRSRRRRCIVRDA